MKMTITCLFVSLMIVESAFAKVSVLPKPRLSLESAHYSSSLEGRDEGWVLTSFDSATKQVSSQKITDPSEVISVNAKYDSIRNWVLETLPRLKVNAECQDIKIRMDGALLRHVDLCSKIQAHRVFAKLFYTKILATLN